MAKATDDHTPTPAALQSACDKIYRAWLRYLPENEAREQAAQFARRIAFTLAVNGLSLTSPLVRPRLIASSLRPDRAAVRYAE